MNAKKKPHLLIFNPDQWRADFVGHLGNPAAVTPHFDKFVETEAVSFRHAFCQNPVCTPSRCSFMTGWYPHVRGHRSMHHMLHPERGEPNLLKLLKEEGYFVWWGGKNDIVPAQDGHEDYCDVHFTASAEDFERWGMKPLENPHKNSKQWRGEPGDDRYYSFMKGRLSRDGYREYSDRDWTAFHGALDFIRSYEGDQPLCIFLALEFPHPPYGVEEPYYSMIDRSKVPERTQPPLHWKGKPLILQGIAENQALHNWTEEQWTELRASYLGMAARVDDQFNRLLEALRERDFYDDTAVFLLSDHGDFTGDFGIVEKTQNTMEDCLTRVPFAIKPPRGVPTVPGIRDALVELVDFSATVFELAGITPGYDSFGKSLLPLVAGSTEEHRDAVFCEGGRRYGEAQATEGGSWAHSPDDPKFKENLYWPRISLECIDEKPYHGKATMCRTKTHKYVKRLYEEDELYDLEADPREQKNRIGDPAYRDILLQLKDRMLQWYQETADVVPRETDERNFPTWI